MGLGRKSAQWTLAASGREPRANGRSIAQRSQRSQRGIGVGAKGCSMDTRASGREPRANGRSIAQRSQRSQRGIGVGAKGCSMDTRDFWARTNRRGKCSSPQRLANADTPTRHYADPPLYPLCARGLCAMLFLSYSSVSSIHAAGRRSCFLSRSMPITCVPVAPTRRLGLNDKGGVCPVSKR